jgi:hypothetical protein
MATVACVWSKAGSGKAKSCNCCIAMKKKCNIPEEVSSGEEEKVVRRNPKRRKVATGRQRPGGMAEVVRNGIGALLERQQMANTLAMMQHNDLVEH